MPKHALTLLGVHRCPVRVRCRWKTGMRWHPLALDTRDFDSQNRSLNVNLLFLPPPPGSSLMGFTSRELRSIRLRHVPLAAVALLSALLASPGQISAAAVSSTEEPRSASHHCKCGMKCRDGSCCCGTRATPAQSTSGEPKPAPPDARPCVDSTPCDDSGLPNAPSSGPDGKGSALAMLAYLELDTSGTFLPSPSRRFLRSRRTSRLDKPPKRSVLA